MVTNVIHAARKYAVVQEIQSGTIRAHRAKAGYNYPAIHLPFSLSRLIGLPMRIYQTVYGGALAFLVVVACGEPRVYTAKSPARIRPKHYC